MKCKWNANNFSIFSDIKNFDKYYIFYFPIVLHTHTHTIMQIFLCNFLQIVDGAWSHWGSWGACSTTCGAGVHIRSRSCDSPTPAYGGHNCKGSNHQSHRCNLRPCPSTSFIISWYCILYKTSCLFQKYTHLYCSKRWLVELGKLGLL